MSIPVALTEIPVVLPRYGTGYLLTTDGERVKAVHVAPALVDGRLRLPHPGRGSLRNVGDGAAVTLVWPPRDDPGFSLIVDGTAAVDGDDVLVTPAGAVLHKPVTASDETAGHPFWVSAFLDLDAGATPDPAQLTTYWAAVTGSTVSPPREEFADLEPVDGHPHLKVQQIGAPGRVHLDLHVPDVRRAASRAVALGAAVVHESEHGFVVLDSPGGLAFCFVSTPACLRSTPPAWEGGHRSLVDQVCLDIPPRLFDAELAFWSTLTGWDPRASSTSAEFTALHRPVGQPLRLLLQRLDDDQPHVSAHLDLACSDRAAELARHLALGATHVADHRHCSVLADPGGAPYCLTDRDPGTGLLPD